MEGFERNNSLSAEQQERLDVLSSEIKPLIKKLAETGLSDDADAIFDETKFRAHEQGIDLTDQQVRDFLRGIANP